MYLKTLEIIGFKSFPDKTRLLFEPGMSAIVGPNGCGKSNISDAIRWVLGEQRPTALRGGKMQDVIFNGTDARKPLNMAEASITFSDCEELLQTEYNEVTLTRRLFRSGEGQYLLNRTPCRLRDIQRLLMGTGIGTASYSVMAQGHIDAILSSRPEDRRAIFEEASGITKFKADRNEAMRKLEQTDANLLRLDDVIREVKRQIGSLQRQAGKARRYQSLREEIRSLDLFANRRRLGSLDIRIRELDTSSRTLKEQRIELQKQNEQRDEEVGLQHAQLMEIEREIGQAAENLSSAKNQLDSARERVGLNTQRIEEYQEWIERDNREMSDTRSRIELQNQRLEEMEQRRGEADAELARSSDALEQCRKRFDAAEKTLTAQRGTLRELRDESIERERLVARLQNQLVEIENARRGGDIQRERLLAEQEQLSRQAEATAGQQENARARITRHSARAEHLGGDLARAEQQLEQTEETLKSRREELAQERSRQAARQAQIEMFENKEEAESDYQSGSRLLLNSPGEIGIDPGDVFGALAEGLNVKAPYRAAVEVALRSWINAVVVRDQKAAHGIIMRLRKRGRHAAVRLVARQASPSVPPPSPPGKVKPLADFIDCSPEIEEAAKCLLADVYLAETAEDFALPLPRGVTVVTRDGDLFRGDGAAELWLPETPVASPLSRRMTLADLHEARTLGEKKTAELTTAIEGDESEREGLRALIRETRLALEHVRRELAQAEGEQNRIERDRERIESRRETVAWETEETEKNSVKSAGRVKETAQQLRETTASRDELVGRIAKQSSETNDAEQEFAARQHELAEKRVQHASRLQEASHQRASADDIRARIGELRGNLASRGEGLASYEKRIADLTEETAGIKSQIDNRIAAVTEAETRAASLQRERTRRAAKLEKSETEQARHRKDLESLHERSAQADLDLAEHRMRRQNRLDRIASEYGLPPEKLAGLPDPDWPDGVEPSLEETEDRVAALNAKAESMGPVNLVAIEEYRQIEERYAFLKAQENDLVKARDQVLDLIRRINKRSAEMFRETFEQANLHFQEMFERLFNGGTARLVLLDADDLLESGIDIVARPPGKKLQSISLLSGGERTMTAVSLLFAIYLIKPSPFCLLDELDAALDDSNIGRFVGVLHDFLHQSQFVLITHNHHTITASNIVYGVTMPEKGVSRIVSLRLGSSSERELGLENGKHSEDVPPPDPETKSSGSSSGSSGIPQTESTAAE